MNVGLMAPLGASEGGGWTLGLTFLGPILREGLWLAQPVTDEAASLGLPVQETLENGISGGQEAVANAPSWQPLTEGKAVEAEKWQTKSFYRPIVQLPGRHDTIEHMQNR